MSNPVKPVLDAFKREITLECEVLHARSSSVGTSYSVGKVVKISPETRVNRARVSLKLVATTGYNGSGVLRSVYACNVVVLNPGALNDPPTKEVTPAVL